MPVLYGYVDNIILEDELLSKIPLSSPSPEVPTMNPNINWQVFSIIRLLLPHNSPLMSDSFIFCFRYGLDLQNL